MESMIIIIGKYNLLSVLTIFKLLIYATLKISHLSYIAITLKLIFVSSVNWSSKTSRSLNVLLVTARAWLTEGPGWTTGQHMSTYFAD